MTRLALPTLDELAADPGKAAGLAPEVVRALWLRCVAVQNALAPVLVGAATAHGAPQAPAADRLLDVEEAARMLGVSSDWLYRRVHQLPFVVRFGRTVRCSARGIERYVRQREGR